jgi:D-arginine dehydrogenase
MPWERYRAAVSWYDFAVVGGGIAGMSAAYELSARGNVVVLEREPSGELHSTGRSAAIFTECYGPMTVRRLAMASRSFLENPGEGFVPDPVLMPRGLLLVGRPGQEDDLGAAAADAQTLVPEVSVVDTAGARDLCPILDPDYVAGGVFEPGCYDVAVHELYEGFRRGTLRRGGDVLLSTGVTAIEERESGWALDTAGGEIGAGVVVNAAGAWCDEVAASAGVAPIGLVPMQRTAFTFLPPPDVDHGRWPFVGDLSEDFYFKPEGALILGSPEDATPVAPHDARPEELDVAIGIDHIQRATSLRIHHPERTWAGLRSFVADGVPVAGMDPARNGFFWLTGQGGYGIKTSPAMAAATAGLIVDGELPDALHEVGLSAAELSPARLV